MIEVLENREPFMVCVSFGGSEDVTLDMCVVKEEFDLDGDRITRWYEEIPREGETVRTDNGISIRSSDNPEKDKRVAVYYGALSIWGKWDTREEDPERTIIYHCYNTLFRFDIMFDISHDPWDGDYESLLHD